MLIGCPFVFGQFIATIQDPDGWTNVRAAPDAQAEVIHIIQENDLFWFGCHSVEVTNVEELEWVPVCVPINDFCIAADRTYKRYDLIQGFIHSSRLLTLESMSPYLGTDFSFQYELSAFDPADKIIETTGSSVTSRINGRTFWGTDGELPKIQIDNIKVEIEGREIIISRALYEDLYNCDGIITIYKNGATYFVVQGNSDGAGTYELAWVFDHKGLRQRLVGSMY
ncbi:MAG: hypothetical protein AAF433_19150 [Bacteroidota bacterium]